jgi:hypothetical protein
MQIPIIYDMCTLLQFFSTSPDAPFRIVQGQIEIHSELVKKMWSGVLSGEIKSDRDGALVL